jgi:hypothetical protein
MRKIVYSGVLFFAFCGVAAAQVAEPAALIKPSSQITLQVGGVFASPITDDGVRYKPASSSSMGGGYRYYLTHWLGVEGDFEYFHDSQKYTTPAFVLAQKTNAAAVSGGVVINLPNPLTKKFQSFFMVGGGALIFHREDTNSDLLTKNAIVFGGGIDIPVVRHLAIRGQANTFLYKAPDFGVSELKIDKFTQAMVPSVGLVYKFR